MDAIEVTDLMNSNLFNQNLLTQYDSARYPLAALSLFNLPQSSLLYP